MFDRCRAKLKVRLECIVKITACKSYYVVLSSSFNSGVM